MHPMLRSAQPVSPYLPQRQSPPPPQRILSDFFVGLDLGALVDPSASAVVRRAYVTEQITDPDGRAVEVISRDARGFPRRRFDILGMRRYEMGTPYTTIVRHVSEQVARIPGVRLCVDASGVGRPIVDMFRNIVVGGRPIDLHAITITGGNSWSHPAHGEYRVSKIELVAAIRAGLELSSIKISRGVDHSETLRKELVEFRIKVSKTENEIYSAREGEHDDLVLATALPVWFSWFLDRGRPYIVGADKVQRTKARDPFRITADLAGLFARNKLPTIRGDHGLR